MSNISLIIMSVPLIVGGVYLLSPAVARLGRELVGDLSLGIACRKHIVYESVYDSEFSFLQEVAEAREVAIHDLEGIMEIVRREDKLD